jgi:hypothetical protein
MASPEDTAVSKEVPAFTSVFSLFSRATSLYLRNFGTIAPITLAIFLPVEAAKNFLVYAGKMQDNFAATVRIEMLLEGVFGSLVTAALIVALMHKIQTGRDLSVWKALSVGATRWGRVFGTRFRAGIYIGLGLLLIVPGLYFAVKFALTDEIATLETQSAARALSRSGELVRGHRWKIIGVSLLSMAVVFGFQVVGGFLLGFADEFMAGSSAVWLVATLVDCLNDVTYRFFVPVMLLVYLGLAKAPDSSDPVQKYALRTAILGNEL